MLDTRLLHYHRILAAPATIAIPSRSLPKRSSHGRNRLTPLRGPAGNFQGQYHAVWTGKEMLVLGPDDFQVYDPQTNRRRAPRPAAVDGAGLVVWTGKQLIDWGGGCCGDAFATGWGFNPITNRWRKLPSPPLAPSQSPSGVWTGHELIVLVSGIDPDGKPYPSSLARIAAYNPVSNAWHRLAPLPASRFNAEVVWDGHEMLVIGGVGASKGGKPGSPAELGFAYDPKTARWRQLAPMPTGRASFPGSVDRQATVDLGREHAAQRARLRSNRKPLVGAVRRRRSSDPPASPRSWTGRSMVLWGDAILNEQYKVFNEGAAFTPTVG